MELSDLFFYCYTTSSGGQWAGLNFSFWLIWMIVVLLFAIVISPRWQQCHWKRSRLKYRSVELWWTFSHNSPDVPNEVLFFKNNLNRVPPTLALSLTQTQNCGTVDVAVAIKYQKWLSRDVSRFIQGICFMVFIFIVQSTNCYLEWPK